MPRLPTWRELSAVAPQSNRAVATVDLSSAAGAARNLGRTIQGAAQEVGGAYIAELDELNRTAAKEGENAAVRAMQEKLFDPDNGYFSKQGRDAYVGKGSAVKELDAVIEQQAKGLANEQQRKLFRQAMELRKTSALEDINRHAINGKTIWENSTSAARIDNAARDAGAWFNNPEITKTSLAIARQEVLGQASRNGWGPDVVKQKLAEADSEVHKARYNAIIANGTDDEKLDIMDELDELRQKGALDLKFIEQLDNEGPQLRANIVGAKAAREIGALPSMDGIDPDRIFEVGMIHAESRGKQFAADGQTLRSPKNAFGISQSLVGTAQDTAKAHGIPWDEGRFMRDAAYNKKLGKLYYGDQVKAFGNPVIAAMAYNAGPGAVRDFMEGTNKTGKNDSRLRLGDPTKGQVSLQEFIARFPFRETRDYARKVVERSYGTGALASRQSELPEIAARLDAKTPGAGDVFIRATESRIRAEEQQRKQQAQEDFLAASTQLDANGGDLASLSPQMIARIRQHGLYDDLLKKADSYDVDDPQTITSIDSLTTQQFMAFDFNNPEIVAGTEEKTRQDYIKEQNKLRQSKPEQLYKEQNDALVYDYARRIDNSSAAAIAENTKQIKPLFERELVAYEAINGKKPTEQERRVILYRLTAKRNGEGSKDDKGFSLSSESAAVALRGDIQGKPASLVEAEQTLRRFYRREPSLNEIRDYLDDPTRVLLRAPNLASTIAKEDPEKVQAALKGLFNTGSPVTPESLDRRLYEAAGKPLPRGYVPSDRRL